MFDLEYFNPIDKWADAVSRETDHSAELLARAKQGLPLSPKQTSPLLKECAGRYGRIGISGIFIDVFGEITNIFKSATELLRSEAPSLPRALRYFNFATRLLQTIPVMNAESCQGLNVERAVDSIEKEARNAMNVLTEFAIRHRSARAAVAAVDEFDRFCAVLEKKFPDARSEDWSGLRGPKHGRA